MMRVGLTQRVMDIAGRGERRDTLDQRWMGFCAAIDMLPIALPNLADERYVAALELQAVILTGGNNVGAPAGENDGAPERDAFERRLLDYCAAASLPVVGVCRGMQMMQVHASGALRSLRGHAGTRHDLSWSGAVPGGPGPVNVNSYHDYGIDVPASDYRALAQAPDGTVEAMAHTRLPWLGIMWHPEREAAPATRDVALLGHYLCGKTI